MLVAALPNDDSGIVSQAVDRLVELTAWQEENQREVAELGGPSLILQLVQARLRFVSTEDMSGSAEEYDIDLGPA